MKKFILITLIAILNSGCIGDYSGASDNTLVNKPSEPEQQTTPLVLSTMGSIPLLNGLPTQVTTLLTNYSNKTLYKKDELKNRLDTVIDDQGNKVLSLDDSACQTIVAHSTCPIVLTVAAGTGSSAVNVNYTDSDKNTYNATTVISYETVKDSDIQDGIYFNASNNHVVSTKNNDAYILPLLLAKDSVSSTTINIDQQQISVSGTPLQCDEIKDTRYSICQIMVDYKDVPQKTLANISIKNQLFRDIHQFALEIDEGAVGNLITDASTIVLNNNTPNRTITLVNNGTGNISNLQINSTNPDLSVTNNDCNDSLASNASCSVTIATKAQVTQDTTGIVNISYNDSKLNKILNLNVLHQKYIPPVNMALSFDEVVHHQLDLSPVNYKNFTVIKVQNNGSVTLDNINFSQLYQPGFSYYGFISSANVYSSASGNPKYSPQCKTDGTQTLTSNQVCYLSYQYIAPQIESGTHPIQATASYHDNNLNYDYSYISTPFEIYYNAIDSKQLYNVKMVVDGWSGLTQMTCNGFSTDCHSDTINGSTTFKAPVGGYVCDKINVTGTTVRVFRLMRAGDATETLYSGPKWKGDLELQIYNFEIPKNQKYDCLGA